ncbi:MAG: hypothetical protein ACP5NV_06605 [Candidatus Woesearchaeota archaeon]
MIAQLYDPDKGYTHPKNHEYTAEDNARHEKIRAKNDKEFEGKFPIDKLIKKHEQASLIKKFTGIKEDTHTVPKTDYTGVLIFTNIPTYATQLNIQKTGSFLQTDMHNGALGTIGLSMTAYGLRALKTIYEAYNISLNDLPVLDFQKKVLKATIPIVHLDDVKKYDLKVGDIQPEITDNAITFEVPYSVGDPVFRSEIAFALLEKATKHAKKNLFLLKEKH